MAEVIPLSEKYLFACPTACIFRKDGYQEITIDYNGIHSKLVGISNAVLSRFVPGTQCYLFSYFVFIVSHMRSNTCKELKSIGFLFYDETIGKAKFRRGKQNDYTGSVGHAEDGLIKYLHNEKHLTHLVHKLKEKIDEMGLTGKIKIQKMCIFINTNLQTCGSCIENLYQYLVNDKPLETYIDCLNINPADSELKTIKEIMPTMHNLIEKKGYQLEEGDSSKLFVSISSQNELYTSIKELNNGFKANKPEIRKIDITTETRIVMSNAVWLDCLEFSGFTSAQGKENPLPPGD
jgi:hypothetical protein